MSCTRYHTVRSQDTLYNIARTYNTTLNRLLALNPGIDANNLRVGQQVCVAGTTGSTACPIGSFAYVVRAGDTFGAIALRYGTTVGAITAANPGVNANSLQIGQTVCVPRENPNAPPCETRNFYVVRAGDSLYAIARVFNTTVAAVTAVNPGLSPSRLEVGQILCIPVEPSRLRLEINLTSKVMTVYRDNIVQTQYLVAIGKPSTPTPTGAFTVINKAVNPGGPYGTRWMGLSERGYGIHGTNNPASIGTAASNGCIRMYNRDVEELFSYTPVGTPVLITP